MRLSLICFQTSSKPGEFHATEVTIGNYDGDGERNLYDMTLNLRSAIFQSSKAKWLWKLSWIFFESCVRTL